MITTSAGRTRRLRITILAATTMLVASVMIAPPAQAADNWSGVWHTEHKFGTPKLKLDLDKQKGPDHLEGIYKDNGETLGTIWGDVSKSGGEEVWEGRYKDNATGGKGKFRVVLKSDKVSFKGWFKACGNFVCSEKYKWKGEHA